MKVEDAQDIIDTAKVHAARAGKGGDQSVAYEISLAILNERDRCAKIADEYFVVVHPHWDVEGACPKKLKSKDGTKIASLIRGTSSP